MVDRWTDRLSEYLDGELGPAEREELDAHLAGCAECAATLRELRAVVSTLAGLPDVAPARDLWSGIEARLGPAPLESAGAGVISLAEHRRRRFSFTLPQLAAAGIALVALSSGIVWLVSSGSLGTGAPTRVAVVPPAVTRPAAGNPGTSSARVAAGGTTSAAQSGGTLEAPAASAAQTPAVPPVAPVRRPGGARLVSAPLTGQARADRDYQRAVGELEALLRREQSHLRPETVAALQKSLADIDKALADARHALARDPGNVYLNAHLAETMRLKVEFLREATSLTQS